MAWIKRPNRFGRLSIRFKSAVLPVYVPWNRNVCLLFEKPRTNFLHSFEKHGKFRDKFSFLLFLISFFTHKTLKWKKNLWRSIVRYACICSFVWRRRKLPEIFSTIQMLKKTLIKMRFALNTSSISTWITRRTISRSYLKEIKRICMKIKCRGNYKKKNYFKFQL